MPKRTKIRNHRQCFRELRKSSLLETQGEANYRGTELSLPSNKTDRLEGMHANQAWPLLAPLGAAHANFRFAFHQHLTRWEVIYHRRLDDQKVSLATRKVLLVHRLLTHMLLQRQAGSA